MSFVYNERMKANSAAQTFRPELISRRGEAIAWASALFVSGAWAALLLTGNRVSWMVPVLALLLLLAAGSISLGNWMDRRTALSLDGEGIAFENGLRHVRLKWEEIRQVQIFPTQWGKKVEVIGDTDHFRFQTLGEVKVGGQVKGLVGFTAGERILEHIVKSAKLRANPDPNRQPPTGAGYDYVRD